MTKLPDQRSDLRIKDAMRQIGRVLASTLFPVFLAGSLHAQNGGFDTVLNRLNTYYPQEKIYIHYDRPYYNTGETIWFKAYLFCRNQPSAISTTMYAELLDHDGKVMERKILPVVHSSAAASFDLPDSMPGNQVTVRAYTAWMLNFDSSFLYQKSIHIVQPGAVSRADKAPSATSLRFFPEGGDMVQGIPGRVAFKATDEKGMPLFVTGDIVDAKNRKVAGFAAMHDGMGFFDLTPAAGESYRAVWKDEKGTTHEQPLPASGKEGVTLGLSQSFGAIDYTIQRSADVSDNRKVLYVVAQMQQQLVYMATINMREKTKVTAPISTEGLSDGIVQVTVFTSDRKPLAERIIFLDNNDYYFITDLHAATKNLTKKAKNVLQVDVGDTLFTNLSISVTDAGTSGPAEENIFSRVLLSSDVRGYVHNPAYYFTYGNDSTQEYLDLVMMTNGWRRFNWDKVLAGDWPDIKYVPNPYITVNGQAFGIRSSLLNGKELTAILQTQNNNKQFFTAPLDAKGSFTIPGLFFYDTAKLYYQINNDPDKTLSSAATFNFKSGFVPGLPAGYGPVATTAPVNIPEPAIAQKNTVITQERIDDFSEGRNVKVLEGVKVTARQKSVEEKMDEEYASGFFKGGDGFTFVTENDPFANPSMTILDYLRGKVAGLQITTSSFGQASVSWRGGTPGIFLNEMQTDLSLIQSTPISDVAMIKVFRPPFMGGAGTGSAGAIAVYTKKGGGVNNDVKGLDFFSVPGYSPVKEFYSPDYGKDADAAKNDYRTTLYWSPFVLFDKNSRRVLIPFYNNDSCKRIRVVIEGVNEEGKMTREEKIFE